ncbi:hypothetical protein E8E14_012737 [Neopestalotiopsis sp. 37M]|nr:hypothetical protein E8E14_012737 [Neopestalotiopsis sp. 37M]
MLRTSISTVLVIVLVLLHSGAQAQLGTFREPAAKVRPRFRYWLPDASVSPETVVADIDAAADIGAGGVEFLPFYNYGYPAPNGSDWLTYGFGTPAFLNIFRHALLAHQRRNLSMDFALGPNQGQGVPAEHTDEGLQWDLSTFNLSIPGNRSYHGLVPGWGTGDLVGLVLGAVEAQQNMSRSLAGLLGPNNATWTQITLRKDSLVDLTSTVLDNGQVSIDVSESSGTYQLFAFYQRRTLAKNLDCSSNYTGTIFDNGSYIVDHFSARGAQTTIQFWEKYMLVDGIDELLMSVGNFGWEDSIESPSNISWSPSLPRHFQEKFNYTITKYLPLIMFDNNNIGLQPTSPGKMECVLEDMDLVTSVRNDYRVALLDGYREYVGTLRKWLNVRLGLPLSSQPAYNLPIDMLASIPEVDAPECESLGWKDSIDAYRQFAGPAHLAGKEIISNELGAVFFKAYQYTIPDLLFSFNRAVIGGINQVVLHGQQYSGNYTDTTWPGQQTFSYIVSEMYSQKQPAWDQGYADMLEYMARVQFIHRLGVPRVDLAVLDKRSATDPNMPRIYQPSDLENDSWTYEYISTDNLDLDQAVAKAGVLGPNGPAFKALVIESHQNLSITSVKKLQKLAEAGLRLVFVGGDLGYFDTEADKAASTFPREIGKLMQHQNSFSAKTGQVSNQLKKLGLLPRVTIKANRTWYNTFRDDPGTGSAYIFVLNDSPTSQGEIVVAGTFSPYLLDPMTGDKVPVINFQRGNSTTTIPLVLAANQTVLLELRKYPDDDFPTRFASLPQSVVGHRVQDTSAVLQVRASEAEEHAVLVNGTSIMLGSLSDPPVPSPISLSGWNLTVEHWQAPANMSDAGIVADKHNTSHFLDNLRSWARVEALRDVSGVGYYSTTFDWHPGPSSSGSVGAYIEMTRILHSVRIFVNGNRLPAFDYRNPKQDITDYLRNGSNHVLCVVPSTMWNYIMKISPMIVNGGTQLVIPESLMVRSDNGLVGAVRIIPFREHFITV